MQNIKPKFREYLQNVEPFTLFCFAPFGPLRNRDHMIFCGEYAWTVQATSPNRGYKGYLLFTSIQENIRSARAYVFARTEAFTPPYAAASVGSDGDDGYDIHMRNIADLPHALAMAKALGALNA